MCARCLLQEETKTALPKLDGSSAEGVVVVAVSASDAADAGEPPGASDVPTDGAPG